MNYNWIVFKVGDKELCRYSIKGTFMGELKATLELLAFENDINIDEIVIKLEE